MSYLEIDIWNDLMNFKRFIYRMSEPSWIVIAESEYKKKIDALVDSGHICPHSRTIYFKWIDRFVNEKAKQLRLLTKTYR